MAGDCCGDGTSVVVKKNYSCTECTFKYEAEPFVTGPQDLSHPAVVCHGGCLYFTTKDVKEVSLEFPDSTYFDKVCSYIDLLNRPSPYLEARVACLESWLNKKGCVMAIPQAVAGVKVKAGQWRCYDDCWRMAKEDVVPTADSKGKLDIPSNGEAGNSAWSDCFGIDQLLTNAVLVASLLHQQKVVADEKTTAFCGDVLSATNIGISTKSTLPIFEERHLNELGVHHWDDTLTFLPSDLGVPQDATAVFINASLITALHLNSGASQALDDLRNRVSFTHNGIKYQAGAGRDSGVDSTDIGSTLNSMIMLLPNSSGKYVLTDFRMINATQVLGGSPAAVENGFDGVSLTEIKLQPLFWVRQASNCSGGTA